MTKISGGESRFSRNVAAGESERPTSATIAEYLCKQYHANDNIKRPARTRGESSQSRQTQQRYIGSLSNMVGLEFTCEAQESQ